MPAYPALLAIAQPSPPSVLPLLLVSSHGSCPRPTTLQSKCLTTLTTLTTPALLQTEPGRYNEAALRGLDYLLEEARKQGIKVGAWLRAACRLGLLCSCACGEPAMLPGGGCATDLPPARPPAHCPPPPACRPACLSHLPWPPPPAPPPALPCPALPCLALPCPALPCLALPCLALPCPAACAGLHQQLDPHRRHPRVPQVGGQRPAGAAGGQGRRLRGAAAAGGSGSGWMGRTFVVCWLHMHHSRGHTLNCHALSDCLVLVLTSPLYCLLPPCVLPVPLQVDFFTREDIKDMYKGFVSTIATRVNSINGRTYKDDPTIMAWVSDQSGQSGQSRQSRQSRQRRQSGQSGQRRQSGQRSWEKRRGRASGPAHCQPLTAGVLANLPPPLHLPHVHMGAVPLLLPALQNLLNEPRCKGCPAGTVAKWYDEMARYTKSVSGGGPGGVAIEGQGEAQPGREGQPGVAKVSLSYGACLSHKSTLPACLAMPPTTAPCRWTQTTWSAPARRASTPAAATPPTRGSPTPSGRLRRAKTSWLTMPAPPSTMPPSTPG